MCILYLFPLVAVYAVNTTAIDSTLLDAHTSDVQSCSLEHSQLRLRRKRRKEDAPRTLHTASPPTTHKSSPS